MHSEQGITTTNNGRRGRRGIETVADPENTAAETTPAAPAPDGRFPKGSALAEALVVAVAAGRLKMRDHYNVLCWLMTDAKQVDGQLAVLAADGLDLRDESFTFKAHAKRAAAAAPTAPAAGKGA